MRVDLGLAGANLIELTIAGRVGVAGRHDPKPGRLIVRDRTPTGDDILDNALHILIAHEGNKPSSVLRPLSKHLRPALHERLAQQGSLRAEHARILGLVTTDHWPTQDARHEEDVRRSLVEVLVERKAPDARTAALVALRHALACEHKVIDVQQFGLTKHELRSRAEETAHRAWASDAVQNAIADTLTTVTAAISNAATSAVVLPGAR
jgi:hypothetical protein